MNTAEQTTHQQDLERLKLLRYMDDDFMTVCLADNFEGVELILRIVLGQEGIKIKSVRTQETMKNLQGRSAVLDVHAIDSTDMLATKVLPTIYNAENTHFAKLPQKKNAAILKKDYNALYTLFTCDGHLLSALCFDFRYLLCRCAHNPYACIAHTVKERVKLPPLRVLLWRRFQKELVYGYIVAEHKLKEYLQTWVLPLVLNVRKVARRDKHFVAYFLAAFLAPCPRRLDCCPKSLEVISW